MKPLTPAQRRKLASRAKRLVGKGRSIRSVAEEFGVCEVQLGNWMRGKKLGESKHNAARLVDLGLAISAVGLRPGQCRTTTELAAYTGLTKQAISHIEHSALRKLRNAICFDGLGNLIDAGF